MKKLLTLDDILTMLKDHKKVLHQQFGVNNIAVFGSYARQEQNRRSDVDICVELLPTVKTFDNYMNLKFFLEKKIGKKVDLVLSESIRPEIKIRILNEAVYG